MGGGGQANSGQAQGAYNSQQAASAQDMALSKQNQAYQKKLMGLLFGNGTGDSGSLTGFLDPSKLEDANLTGAYKSAYNQGTNQLGKDYENARGSLAQSWANRGMGSNSTPSGFQADQERKMGSDLADSRGAAFSDALGKQHSEALNNFWNASNVASGNAASTGSGALQGSGQSGSSSAGIYGTAGQYHAGQLVPALSSVGSAAMCPATNSQILMHDGSWKRVENLEVGDKLLAIDGTFEEVYVAPKPSKPQPILEFEVAGHACRVSMEHWFVRPGCGYVLAKEMIARRLFVHTLSGVQQVLRCRMIEPEVCWDLTIGPSHSYCVDGFWSLG